MEAFAKLLSSESLKQRSETLTAFSFFDSSSSSTSQLAGGLEEYRYLENIISIEDSLFAIAANNYAICALNLRRIKVS
jgi:hypothetical protein